MQRFDCLAKETVVTGPHFLEASAGTGKTFAIEHIFARLLLGGIELEEILVVTFTRAATRELKLRLRSNLEQIAKGAQFGYLDGTSPRRIEEALARFDRCQIFTIHGFCSRLLHEFALEAGLAQCDATKNNRESALRDFFEFGLTSDIICSEQLDLLLRSRSVKELASLLKKSDAPETAKNFSERLREFTAALIPLDPQKLQEDWALLRGNYKKIKGDFEAQIEALVAGDFATLIREKGSIFEFISPENKKVRAKEPLFLHYPEFFDWGRQHLYPLIESAADPKEILDAALAAWKPIDRKILWESGQFENDELLRAMQIAMQSEAFRRKVEAKYRAVLIDEFQDTDPIQWEIFERLFVKAHFTLYLIGDPKQSIYRFRKADLYTYLKAKESIGAECHYCLDTNYRSSPQLIDALNRLFQRDWLYLPKEKKYLPYHPVQAGRDLASVGSAIHFFRLPKEEVYAYTAREIQQKRLEGVAILVKDRYEAARMQKMLSFAGIPSVARSKEPLAETLAFEAVGELLEALREPRDVGKVKAVLAGPFRGFRPEFRKILDEKGFPACMRAILEEGCSFDCLQVLEILFEWERKNGFSFEGASRFLEAVRQADPEEAVYQRKQDEAEGVQIMTIHASKGLEFETVFAIGLGSKSPAADEEMEAEKLRQLYVAMTRAKTRLYVPITDESGSPIALFLSQGDHLSADANIAIETVDLPILVEPAIVENAPHQAAAILDIPSYLPSYLLSFTTLSKDAEVAPSDPMPEGQLPRGPETGVVIHRIFERVFAEKEISRIVEEELLGTPLFPWKDEVIQKVQASLELELPFGFRLADLKRVRTEVEFLFADGENYLKGFIDLLFEWEGKVYFVDWKTNWLGDYSQTRLQAEIASHRYDLQASIYAEAIRRSWNGLFGGAIYLFVRGPSAVCFTPENFR